jgi:hypothetical protein
MRKNTKIAIFHIIYRKILFWHFLFYYVKKYQNSDFSYYFIEKCRFVIFFHFIMQKNAEMIIFYIILLKNAISAFFLFTGRKSKNRVYT